MAGEQILIVDDERSIRTSLSGILQDEGYQVVAVGSSTEALATLEEIKRHWPHLAVIMISGHGTIETAVRATKLGAYDFIEKPLSLEKTLLVVERALEHTRLERDYQRLREQIEGGYQIIGDSTPIRELRRQIAIAAPTNGRVLIYGENGAGKELVARALPGPPPR